MSAAEPVDFNAAILWSGMEFAAVSFKIAGTRRRARRLVGDDRGVVVRW